MWGAAATYALTPSGPGERDLGLSILRAAEAAGLRHLVLASVASAAETSPVAHFVSKAQIERAASRTGIPTTVLAPTWFFENLLAQRERISAGELALALPADAGCNASRSQIWELAATVLLAGPPAARRRIELAVGDECQVPRRWRARSARPWAAPCGLLPAPAAGAALARP